MSEIGALMQKNIFRIDYRVANPLLYHLLAYMLDPNIRRITNYGGSSSGKTYSITQAILMMTEYDACNTIVFRKVGASISTTVWEDFKVASRQLGMFDRLRFKESIRRIEFENGARIDFKGLDNPEKIKGISNYKRVFKDELSEFDKSDDDQIRKRLRGMECQQIIDAFNPISESHWIKTDYIDKEEWDDAPMEVSIFGRHMPRRLTQLKAVWRNKARMMLNPRTGEMEEHPSDTILTQTTYLNNFWVVGSPDSSFGFYDRQCIADFEKDRLNNPYLYNIYALGEWGVVQTGSEFFSSFNRGVHVTDCQYDPTLPIHISVDNNVLPYITTTYWQVDYESGTHIRQIGETLATPPDNTVKRAAGLVAKRLKELNPIKVILHGDASTKAASTFDEEARSWMDLFIDTLRENGVEVEDKVGNKNPSVILSGEFINSILASEIAYTDIAIDKACKTSITDYMSVQKDENGGMQKVRLKNKATGQTYEEFGHCSDTFRYFVIDILRHDFLRYSNKRKRNLFADGRVNFYNAEANCQYDEELVYCLPNIDGRFVLVHGRKCGGMWHLVQIRFCKTLSTEQIKEAICGCECPRIVIECAKAYFIMAREIRDGVDADVRVIRQHSDMAKRIAATSDFVRDYVQFNSALADEDEEYVAFLNSVLDYSAESRENMEASAALSGFIQTAIKMDL